MPKPEVDTTDAPRGMGEVAKALAKVIELATAAKWKSSQAEYIASDIEAFATDALDTLGRACEEERAYFNSRGEEWT